jgi:NitT/TauT family transport system substrate-binding protein
VIQPARSEVLVSPARPHRRKPRLAAVAALLVAVLAGCSTGGADGTAVPPSNPPTVSAAPGESAEPSVTPTRLVVGLGYIPSVQFAQFYLAKQNGYYADAGLDVEFQNKIDPDLITLVGQGSIDVGIGDGTSVIPAVSNGIPVAYIATIYGKFPNIVFAKASSGIAKAADLKGKKVGIPGRYGSGWIMLQALLASAGLTTEDIEIVEYPDFTQEIAVERGAVDAATGFVNNEPVQLELHGEKASILRIDAITPLPGPGLVSGTSTLDEQHDAVSAFVTATLQAMEEIKADPTVGLEAAIKAVPELAQDRETQAALLAATVDTWSGTAQEAHGLGAIDRAGWEKSITFLQSLGLTKAPVATDQLVREDLLPAGG